MTLKKKDLIKAVRPGLETLGYTYLKDSILGGEGLFAKKISDKYYLTLGLTIHRYYEDAFTGDFYLSTNLLWASTGLGYPWLICYKRIGEYLTKDELASLRNHDGWWRGEKPNSVKEFISMVALSEARFLATPKLFKEIDNSKGITNDTRTINLIKELVARGDEIVFDFKEQPNKEIDGIPMIWFKAAEKIIYETDYPYKNKFRVKILASGAYHQTMMEKKE